MFHDPRPAALDPDLADDDLEPTRPDRREAGARVLVVEDDAALRQLVATRLRRDGFDVIATPSGREAREVLAFAAHSLSRFDAIDLVVMDHRMPGVTGLEVARELRAARCTVPVVLITAFPDAAVVREAARLGLRLLPKPFGLDRLSDTAIGALLESHGLRSA